MIKIVPMDMLILLVERCCARLFQGHIVYYTLDSVNIAHQFGSQILFRRIVDLASESDHAFFCVYRGVFGAG